jgi:uncharacterized RDD family membrane protein YckC
VVSGSLQHGFKLLMATQYCSKCGVGVMPTMRICPACGNRSFSPTPLNPAVSVAPGDSPQSPTLPSSSSTSAPTSWTKTPQALPFTPAGHWRRVFAYLIDYLIIAFAAGVIGAIAGLVGVGNQSVQGAYSGGVLVLLGAALPFIYFTILHSRPSGASWGKAAMSLRVVTLGGERLTPVQAFTRCLLTLLVPVAGWIFVGVTAAGTLGSDVEALKGVGTAALIIGVLAISFGPYLTVFFNPQRQTLFDLICKTCVIRAK